MTIIVVDDEGRLVLYWGNNKTGNRQQKQQH